MNLSARRKLFAVFFDGVALENVALFDIVEFFKSDTALISLGNLFYRILKALERGDLVVCNNDTVTYNSYACITLNLAAFNIGACNKSDALDFDNISDLGSTQHNLSCFWSKHTFHCRFNLFNTVVNYSVKS